ncbi:MAG: hypothetical protein MUC96_36335, partial [Myxococcaceae bacterium]|nr:hypothetical protein [Myxococcaceae bacterium]
RARAYFDDRLRQLCGATFDPDAVGLVEAWEECGAVPDGIVGELRADIALANRRLLAAQTRVSGMVRRIAVGQDAIARPRGERSDNLYFSHPDGYTVNVSALTAETFAATQRLIQAISRAQPVDASVLAGSFDVSDTQLEAVRGEVQVAHDVLLAAQTMRALGVVNTPELAAGMHDLQKQCVELTQLRAEVMVDGVGVLEAGLRLHNALHEAKALGEERRRALALVGLNPATDPAFRLVHDRAALDVLATRARAQRQLYLAGRALEYETNTPLPFLERAALRARSALKLGTLSSCLQGIADSSRAASDAAQDYSTDVSVRQMLGIVGPRRDEVTGLEMSEGEQFRRLLLQNPNFDGVGGVSLRFPTAWWHDARLWPDDVCDDRISSVSAQLVGRNLGDSAAEIRLTTSGGAVVQACGSGAEMRAWFTGAGDSVGEEHLAVLKAGVNSLDQASPSNAFFGQSVARAAWELVLPGDAEAPSNRDLNLGALEDVVLRIKHRARAVNVTTPPIDLSCLRDG